MIHIYEYRRYSKRKILNLLGCVFPSSLDADTHSYSLKNGSVSLWTNLYLVIVISSEIFPIFHPSEWMTI